MDESGRVRGLAFYVIEDDRIDLAGITSDDVSATDALLDGVIAAARETGARWIRTLTFDGAASLRSGLTVRGFQAQRTCICSIARCPMDDAPGSRREASRALAFDAWRETDVEPVARLLRRAGRSADAALFAPNGEPAEWVRY